MNGLVLREVSDEMDLGVTVTSDLKAASQITEACRKANPVLGMISCTIKFKIDSPESAQLVQPRVKY